jgi:hypothetical protein
MLNYYRNRTHYRQGPRGFPMVGNNGEKSCIETEKLNACTRVQK